MLILLFCSLLQREIKREAKNAIEKLQVRTLRRGDPVLCLLLNHLQMTNFRHFDFIRFKYKTIRT